MFLLLLLLFVSFFLAQTLTREPPQDLLYVLSSSPFLSSSSSLSPSPSSSSSSSSPSYRHPDPTRWHVRLVRSRGIVERSVTSNPNRRPHPLSLRCYPFDQHHRGRRCVLARWTSRTPRGRQGVGSRRRSGKIWPYAVVHGLAGVCRS